MIDATLLVIAKAPIAGLVKTRLCPPCEPDEAAAIALAALVDTLRTCAALDVARRVLVLDGGPGEWLPPGYAVVPQVEGGLARRLAGAFTSVEGPAFLVGMDTPQLSVATLELAFARLVAPDTDAVLGRATDGGWWGIGFRHAGARAFDGVPMSTGQTANRQLERMRALAMRVHELDVMRDVDLFDDAQHVASLVPGSDFARAVRRVDCAVAQRRALVATP